MSESLASFLKNPWVIDLIVAVIFLLFALISGKKGFYKSIMPLVVLILSALCAVFLSGRLTAPVTERYFPKVEARLTEAIDFSALSEVDASAPAEKLLALLPEEIAEMVEQFGLTKKTETALNDALQSLSENGEVKTETVVLTAAKKVLSGAVHIVLFVILFVVCLIVLSILQRLLSLVFKLPIIRTVDRMLGAALGLVTCALLLLIAAWVLKLADSTFLIDRAAGTHLLSLFVR